MKQQCTTAAQCHRELARVMEQFGIADSLEAVSSRYVTAHGIHWGKSYMPTFEKPAAWCFAIAEVEGKPVFPGDDLYTPEGCKISVCVGMTHPHGFRFDQMSWNQPKPTTVMVEMRREVAEVLAHYSWVDKIFIEAAKDCAKALKKGE